MNKILIWGTGNIANKILNNGLNAEIMGFIETYKVKESFQDKPIYSITEIPENYDYIIVANSYVKEIYQICLEKNINLDKVIFLKKMILKKGFLEYRTIKDILGEVNYTNYCNEFAVKEHSFFEEDLKLYKKLNTRQNFDIQQQYIKPIITDKYASAGTMGNYFYQDLWAAKLIYQSGIKNHFDIGSRIDGFIAHLLAMNIKVSLIDVRKFPGEVEGLYTIMDDATQLKQILLESVDSMSALCSLEHFGLGRYGDPVDPEACFQCFEEMQKRIRSGGNLYISLPIGKERVEFNAHRVFYPSTVIENFPLMKLVEFSCTAGGKMEYNVEIHKYDFDESDGDYRYGLFHFVKK